jgi:SAM-dependent methyltransferase
MSEPPEKRTDFDTYAGNYAELIYDPIREKFATENRFFAERKLQVIRDFYKQIGMKTRNLAWLDVGCGQGDLLRLGRSHFKTAMGCDPSSRMLQACPDLEVRHQSSLISLPFDAHTFDFITAVGVYHHVAESQRHLLTAEALRLLRRGGILCIIEHNPLNPVTRLIVSRTPVDADARLLGAREVRRMLSSAGTRLLDTRYFLLFPERIHRYAAALEDWLAPIPLGGQYSVFAERC